MTLRALVRLFRSPSNPVFLRLSFRPRSVRASRRRVRPLLECLEDRCLLSYSITDLGTLGGNYSTAYGINSAGRVVGESKLATGATDAFFYDGSVMHDLGTLPGGNRSQAVGINASGQVVGYSTLTGNSAGHAVLWNPDGTMTDLGTLPGGNASQADGINASGQVVGWSRLTGNSQGHAFFYDGTTMTDLGTLGGTVSAAYGINASGQVVGESNLTGDSVDHAFFYDGTTMNDLGTLGGTYSVAWAINASGQAAGGSNLIGDSVEHAFFYDGTNLNDLGTLPGGDYSEGHGINTAGQVVGASNLAGNSTTHAFFYDGMTMSDLNDLIPPGSGWVLHDAWAINDNGQIAGSGTINNQTHAFLLTPSGSLSTPRPGTGFPAEPSLLGSSPSPAVVAVGSVGVAGPTTNAPAAPAPVGAAANPASAEPDLSAGFPSSAAIAVGSDLAVAGSLATMPSGSPLTSPESNSAKVVDADSGSASLRSEWGAMGYGGNAPVDWHSAAFRGATPASTFDQPAASLAVLDAAFADLAVV